MSEGKIIHQFKKNANEKVIMKFTEFKGKELIDIRVYYLADVLRQEWKPSKKGICISVDLLEKLKEGLDKALSELQSGNEGAGREERDSE